MHGFVAYFLLSAMKLVRFPSRFALDTVSDKLIFVMLFSGVKSVFFPMPGVKSKSMLVFFWVVEMLKESSLKIVPPSMRQCEELSADRLSTFTYCSSVLFI